MGFRILIATLFFLLTFAYSQHVFAISDPLSVPDNRFGIHIIDEHDLEDAARLVNSSRGDWGYVAIVIPEEDRNQTKWQRIFDRMRKLRLIPIVRLATKVKGDTWEKPSTDQAEGWATFLNSLNWVVQNRYIILFNEPNQAREWGGKVDPKEYTDVLKSFSRALKDQNEDFFILNAGFDTSAPNEPPNYMDEEVFVREMLKVDSGVFSNIDGWASHSYPNPDFSSKPTRVGRGSVRTFEWELSLLKKLVVKKDFPVFITETGWSREKLSEKQVSIFFQDAYKNAWNKKNIVAVVPFLLNYQDKPFLSFSWRKNGTGEFFKQYEDVQKLTKVKGEPAQIHKGEFSESLPESLIQDSDYLLTVKIKNTGQSIWDPDDGYTIAALSPGLKTSAGPFIKTPPFSDLELPLRIKTTVSSAYKISISVVKNGSKIFSLPDSQINVISPLKLNFKTRLVFEQYPKGDNFTLKILDGKHEVLAFNNIPVENGVGVIPAIYNLIPQKEYTFQLEKQYFLPKKVKTKLDLGQNTLAFGVILPLDQNKNNRLDFLDFLLVPLNLFRTLQFLVGGKI